MTDIPDEMASAIGTGTTAGTDTTLKMEAGMSGIDDPIKRLAEDAGISLEEAERVIRQTWEAKHRKPYPEPQWLVPGQVELTRQQHIDLENEFACDLSGEAALKIFKLRAKVAEQAEELERLRDREIELEYKKDRAVKIAAKNEIERDALRAQLEAARGEAETKQKRLENAMGCVDHYERFKRSHERRYEWLQQLMDALHGEGQFAEPETLPTLPEQGEVGDD